MSSRKVLSYETSYKDGSVSRGYPLVTEQLELQNVLQSFDEAVKTEGFFILPDASGIKIINPREAKELKLTLDGETE